jgi:alpha-amylase/alpha-mannosidase (GH57 family)
MRSVVIHGHFYQPPRDDPWRGTIPLEPSAAPFHDWNERIARECYAPVSGSLASLSFDFGPTLLAWMERAAPETYAVVLAADRASVARHAGHGNALAMPYHHTILPLSPRRDKVTEVRWGMADFRRRFGREPEGMWLPETAVDDETLDVLAAEGIRFTMLAPHQVERPPTGGLPGWYRTATGRRIAVFLYDGALSHAVAFGPLVRDPAAWAERLTSAPSALVAIATDGETFGHHHREGAVTLARVLDTLRRRQDLRVDNCAAFLDRHSPEEDVRLVAPSSWSCPHGVERWRAECGCRVAPERGLHQRWRAPLRAALDWLAGELHAVFEREGRPLFGDPWAARDAYGAGLGAGGHRLLEMERHALRMFTSCGWFFDDIAGLESVIVLRSAARAIELAGPAGESAALEAGLLERLALAPSNDPAVGSGRELYLERVKAQIPRAAVA